MANQTFKLPTPRNELAVSLAGGTGFALALFVLMALAQTLGEVVVPKQDVSEEIAVFDIPDIEEFEEEEPPPPPEEEPPPELEVEPPQLSLAQLDIALNPGTGGSLAGDFAMPTIAATSSSLGTEDFVDFSDLDQTPKPMPGYTLRFPRRLQRKPANGRVVLLIKLNEQGEVVSADIESSNLPDFEKIVAEQVAKWKFTPPTKEGTPVRAQARFPIPIRIAGS